MDGEQRFYECIGLIWQKLNIAYGVQWLILGFTGFRGGPRMRGDDGEYGNDDGRGNGDGTKVIIQ